MCAGKFGLVWILTNLQSERKTSHRRTRRFLCAYVHNVPLSGSVVASAAAAPVWPREAVFAVCMRRV